MLSCLCALAVFHTTGAKTIVFMLIIEQRKFKQAAVLFSVSLVKNLKGLRNAFSEVVVTVLCVGRK